MREPVDGIEPALIDPRLPVGESPDWSGRRWPGRPSYASFTPEERRGYLEWLSGVPCAHPASALFARLWFFGVERRWLVDVATDPAVFAEVHHVVNRLVHLHPAARRDWTLRRHIDALLDAAAAWLGPEVTGRAVPAWAGQVLQPPVWVRADVAGRVGEHGRLDAGAVLRLVHAHPCISLGIVGERCRDHFDELFGGRFAARYPDGVPVRVGVEPLEVFYEPMNPGFGRAPFLTVQVPVVGMGGMMSALRDPVEWCREDLRAYARKLGRDPGANGSWAGLALIPAELLRVDASLRTVRDDFAAATATGAATLNFEEITARVGLPGRERVTKNTAGHVASVLEALGFGLEPDPRLGPDWPVAGKAVVLFRIERDAGTKRADTLRFGYALAQLLVAIRGVTCVADTASIVAEIAERCMLDGDDRRRLGAFTQWVVTVSVGTGRLSARVRALREPQRRELLDVALGEALRACVGAPHRLGVATDALVACGGDASAFIEARHAQRCGNDSEPVLIDQPMATSGYPIPAPPIAEVTVDPVLVSQLTVAHARSAHWLGALLEEPEPVAPAATGSDCAYELTGRLRQFATALVITGSWSAEAFRALAAEHGLMAEAARDALNELALVHADVLVCDGDDPIEIDVTGLKELLDE